ncbi:uncharacterized protein LOC116341308 [Contarinia nasturtii]|uniref:uncharacterized protein LOC116341308 n=1 Tax=Contarinia nasturtii TaxID=265458 RepID=UPI0012D3D7BC|nr:uncharacterized protein LOC116341308 [Contarinia nasturtii]
MRSISFVTIFSIFLFIQLVNSEKPLTFAKLLNKFYSRAKNTKPKFDFLLKITKDVDSIKQTLEHLPARPFMDESLYEQHLTHVPKNMKLNGTEARQFLREKIEAINEGQTTSIKAIDDVICTRMSFKSHGIQDSAIEESYQNWVDNSFDSNHLKQINADYPTMKSKFDNWHKMFNEDITEANALRAEIKANINKSVTIFRNLARIPEKAVKITENDVDTLLDTILARQYRLIERLESISNTLSKYNAERIKWTEFLIGMRATLESNPKPVDLIAKKKKSFF